MEFIRGQQAANWIHQVRWGTQ